MKKKLRLQLFNKEGVPCLEKWVDQATEFYAGPKEAHDGLIRVEFTLGDQGDVEKAKRYLDQLTGNLELPRKRGRTAVNNNNDIEMSADQRKELLDVACKKKDQNAFFDYLRNEGDFRFVDQSFLKSLGLWGKLGLSKIHEDVKYSYMMRAIKFAKDPKNDKYDPQMVVVARLIGKRMERITLYLNGEKYKVIKLSIPKHQTEVLKTNGAFKFDKAMTEDERDRFRKEHRELVNGKPAKSKFYRRWEPFVKMPK